MLCHGIYEQVINHQISRELENFSADCKATTPIDRAEASRILSQYLGEVVRKGLDSIVDEGGTLDDQIALSNRIIDLVRSVTKEASFSSLGIDRRAELLLALLKEKDPRLVTGRNAWNVVRPETSLSRSSLFTGALHEPQMYMELKREAASADRMDMLVSFIKWSGLRLIIDELRTFVHRIQRCIIGINIPLRP